MAFIGNSVQNQGFAPAVDYFNGDGTTVTFTLSRPVASVAQLTAVIENVIQNPTSAFTVSGNQITFTSAPPAGTNNIWVEYTSLITQYNGISQDPSVVGDITASGGYLSTGDFGNSYLDGTIVDYVTGISRITTGPSDGITLYNGGTSARTALMTISSAGNVGVGTTSPSRNVTLTSSGNTTLQVTNSTSGTGASDGFIVQQNGLNTFVLNQEAGALYLGTSNTERLNIDSSGYVTMPYQPAFMAGRLSDTSTGNILGCNTVLFNRGGHYNSSTFRFTAPVSGVYYFTWGGLGNTSQTVYRFTLQKNGSSDWGSGGQTFQVRLDGNVSGSYNPNVYGSATVQLQANDYVDVYYGADNGAATISDVSMWSKFGGYLIG